MKLKFNWGTGIFIVILIFLGTIALRIYLSYRQDLNLISEDYYPKEILFQETINKKKNLNELDEKVDIIINKENIVITFPTFFSQKTMNGEIWLYRPSDSKLDLHIPLKADAGLQQKIPVENLLHGKWVVIIDMECDSVSYYLQKDIFLE